MVRVENFYVSYVAPMATREPTPAEYDEMVNRTNTYFQGYFDTYFANMPNVMFMGVESTSDFTLYGAAAGIPEARFNIYINFSFSVLTYSESSMPPTSAETFKIMKDSITPDYILNVVRTFTGSPFESTNEAYFAASTTKPP
jgi:hypothetical protein